MLMKSFGNKYKKVVRDHIANLVKPNMTIFSLPYLNFQIEGRARRSICCEIDKSTYLKQKSIAPKNCLLHHAKASEVIGLMPFDLIFLDLCGSISHEFFTCLERLSLNPGGTAIITVLRCREPKKYHKWFTNGRVDAYTKILAKYGLNLYKIIEYYDTSAMMVLFANEQDNDHVTIYDVK